MTSTDEFFNLVSKGEIEPVRDLLRENPKLAEQRNGSGSTALQWAAYNRQTPMIGELLSADPAVDIWTACAIGKLDSVKPLDQKDEMSPDGFTPLGLAAAFEHNLILKLLIGAGADVNLPSRALGKVPPLQSAVFGRNLEGFKMLLEAGADVNATQGGGFTALMGAAQNGDEAMVAALIARGANPHYATADNKTALDLASNDQVRKAIQGALR